MDLPYNFTIRKRKSRRRGGETTYQLILSYRTRDGRWKQHAKGGYLLRSVAASDVEKEKLLEEIRKTGDLDPARAGMTLKEFSDMYLNNRSDLAANSSLTYRNLANLAGELADKPMKDITYVDVSECLTRLDKSVKTKKLFVWYLQLLFREAVRYKVVPSSPIEELRYTGRDDKAGEEKRVRTFTQAEIARLLEYMHTENREMWILCAIAAYTGARAGELLALTRSDIDLSNQTVTINKQLARTEDSRHDVKRLKSKHSNRVVPIPARLCAAMADYDGMSVRYIHRRLTRYTSANEINDWIHRLYPHHSVHDFRHTYATRLLSQGVDLKTVAALLGDTVTTVARTYIHYTDEMRRAAADSIGRIFG